MSISYGFTDHGTILIHCGDDFVEVRLPAAGAPPAGTPAGAGTGGGTSPASGDPKPTDKPKPTGDWETGGDSEFVPIDIDDDFPLPPIPLPMLVVARGNMPLGSGAFSFDLPVAPLDISEIAEKTPAEIDAMAQDVAGVFMVDLKVDRTLNSDSPVMRKLMDQVDDPTSRLNAVRIWKK